MTSLKLFFSIDSGLESKYPTSLCMWSLDGEWSFQAHIDWEGKQSIEDDISRELGPGPKLQSAMSGQFVVCSGDRKYICAELSKWLNSFPSVPEVWMTSIQDSIFQLSLVRIPIPVFDVTSLFKKAAIPVVSLSWKARRDAIAQTNGVCVRTGAYTARNLYNSFEKSKSGR